MKFIVYFIHERIWLSIQFEKRFGGTRTLFKTLSWRVIATVITFIVAGEILNSQDNAALYIAGIGSAIIEVDGEEIPIMDGSAKNFLEVFRKTELKQLLLI